MRKRTPRFPVSFSHKKDVAETYASPSKRGRKLEVDTNDDKVARVAALTLAEASQRGGSPQISQTSYRRTEHITSSPAQSWERMVFTTHLPVLQIPSAFLHLHVTFFC